MRLLFIGDIVGRPGREWVNERVNYLREQNRLDFVVANAENSAAGAGITKKIANRLLESGVDGITLGDHVWDQRGFVTDIESLENVCRPANLNSKCPGKDHLIIEKGGFRLGVFSVIGRQFMPPRDCPFRSADEILRMLEGKVDAIVAEMHCEATSEKIAFGRYLDGRVAAVVGTHTHVPTADACILPKGTAYITDLGMSGPYESVLGREIDPVLNKFLDGMPRRFGVAEHDVRTSGALIELESNKATSIQLITDRKPAAEGEEELA
jgi:metallophosphoesterase (TIGR00282 family)